MKIYFYHQDNIVTDLYIMVQYWSDNCVIKELPFITNKEGYIEIEYETNIKICIDARSPFQDFNVNEVHSIMILRVDFARQLLLNEKLKWIVTCYHIQSIDYYSSFQSLLGLEDYPIYHHLVLSIINQMYLELQEH